AAGTITAPRVPSPGMSPLSCAALVVALASPNPGPTRELAPRPPPWQGTGLLIAGSVAGLAGLGIGIGAAHQVAAIERCPGCPGNPSFAQPFTSVALNTAAFTLVVAGAALRGRADRRRFTDPGPPQTALRLGALLVGGGGVLIAGALAWRLLDAQR